MLESGKRISSKSVKKTDIINIEMLKLLCDIYSNTDDILHIRDLIMFVLEFAGFFRFSEISQLQYNSVKFKIDYITLKIRKSKTDIYRSGKEVLIAKVYSFACPYSMLKRYFQMSSQDNCSNWNMYFRSVIRSKSNVKLSGSNKQTSYTKTRKVILNKMKIVAPDLNLGTHSLRASGASAAANADQSDINERCLLRHGRWKSEVSKNGYISDSVEKRLRVTKKLQL